ncbi:aminoglycoside phosphotransferase family protein [Nocardioides sp. 1609]|uniref:phosphotransferase family protein n=1 Tax=Nocardioides sp. 1609 TaxID=2508327 RepID=UPI00107062E7|nr:aminoglycoside phosphotransferase family protein [Nocardioides sp. 1609]
MHTHALRIGVDVVRKRYVSWDDDEADREWTGLTALAEHAPGLAPVPIAREVEDGAPVVVMSRLPGEPLGGAPVPAQAVAGLAVALRRLFAVPVAGRERVYGPTTMRAAVRDWAAGPYDVAACQDPALVGAVLDRTRTWLAVGHAWDRVHEPVAARGDGNLDNVLWDGAACRLVDFEEFGVSDLAFEVADVVEHASSRLGGLLDVPALLLALDLDEARRARLAHFRRLLAAFWFVMLLPGNGGFARNPVGSTEDQARHLVGLVDDPAR